MPLGAQSRQEREPIEPGDAEVEHDEIGRIGVHHRERLPHQRRAPVAVVAADVAETARPEELDLDDWVRLTEAVGR